MNFQAVSAAPSELGESPFWHPLERLLFWVDIAGRKIMRARADGSSAAESWAMPSAPGCIAPADAPVRLCFFHARRYARPTRQFLSRLIGALAHPATID